MQGIGDLPVELLPSITNQISRKDLLNLRLEIYLPIDTSDDLERWKMEEGNEGVALQRLVDVSQSRIVEHVRVLVLRVARPYSLVAAFDKRDAARKKKPPLFLLPTSNGSVGGWIQRTFGSMRVIQDPPTPKPSNTHLLKQDYAGELAKALQALISSTDLITTIRLAQPTGYNSPFDILYPTVYGRALTRLFSALLGVTFAPSVGTTLELHDCPVMHLQESGLSLDNQVVKKVGAKFSCVSLETRRMEYTLDHQAKKRTQLGRQLVDGLRASGDHFTGLSFRGTSDWMPKQFIVSEDNYPRLTHVVLTSIWISSTVFVPFVSKRLPQLILLHARDIHFDEGEIRWQEAFDIWRAVKKSIREQGQRLKLEHLNLGILYDGQTPGTSRRFDSWVDETVISTFIEDILPPLKRERDPFMLAASL